MFTYNEEDTQVFLGIFLFKPIVDCSSQESKFMNVLSQFVNLSVLGGESFQYRFKVKNADGTPFSLDGCIVSGKIVFSGGVYILSNAEANLYPEKNTSNVDIFIPEFETAAFPIGAASYSIQVSRQYESAVALSGNFTVIDPAYPLSYNTAWDDLRISGSAFKSTGGIKTPDFSLFTNDGGSSHGVYLYWFDPSTIEDVFFYVQMPHNWKAGSAIEPHIHFVPKSTGASNAFVVWGLEHTIAAISGSFGSTSIIYTDGSTAASATVQGDAVLTSGKHYISAFPSIVLTGKTISTMILCRLFRAVGDTYDTYAYDAGVLEFDFHYEIDGFGSKDEYTR
jgi:hypothetical protein